MKLLRLLAITALVFAVANGLLSVPKGKLSGKRVARDSNRGTCSYDDKISYFVDPVSLDLYFYYDGEGGYLDRSCIEEDTTGVFQYCFTVTIGEGFSTIGELAFADFPNLYEVSLPSTLKTIEDGAFSYDPSLSYVEIPNGVETIGESAFEGSYLPLIEIPDTVTSIGRNAFKDCERLEGAFIYGPITAINEGTFENCPLLQYAPVPETVKTIGERAFYGCGSLSSMDIPSSVTKIGEYAFKGCKSLTAFAVDSENEAFKSDDYGVLFDKDGLILMAYPAGRDGSYIIPDDVMEIAGDAFYNCEQLTSLTIPASVESIVDCELGFLFGSPALTSIAVDDENEYFKGIDGVLFKKEENDKLSLMRYPQAREDNEYKVPDDVIAIAVGAFRGSQKTESVAISGQVKTIGVYAFAESELSSVSIPDDSVESIGHHAFYLDEHLIELTIPDSVTSIGYEIFYGCVGLETVSLSSNIPKIPLRAFANCYSLKDFTIPAGVTEIAEDAFANCRSIISITIPAGVKSIGATENEFASGCVSLTSISLDGGDNGVFKSAEGVLFKYLANGGFSLMRYPPAREDDEYTVPADAILIDLGSFRGAAKTERVVISDGVQYVNSYAFAETAIHDFDISDSVVYLGDYAFNNNKVMEEIVVPDSVEAIGTNCFLDCSALRSVTLSSMLEEIPDLAFGRCFALEEINIPDSVLSIGDKSFWNCVSLASITIPFGVVQIGPSAFEDCDSLVDVVIPDSVQYIEYQAFMDCDSLTTLYISKNAVYIGDNAFIVLPRLKRVEIPASVQYWGMAVFQMDSGLEEVVFEDGCISVPYGLLYGCNNLKNVTLPDTIEAIEDYAFCGCEALTSVSLPDGVYYIGSNSFALNHNLVTINIPNNVEIIGDTCFAECSSLVNISIPSGVLTLPEQCFYGCRNLRFVELKEGLEEIGNLCFAGCSRLVNVSIPSTVTFLGSNAFADCLSLEYSIHATTADVLYGESVYKGCKNLVSIDLPEKLDIIPGAMFYGCSSLKSITIPSKVKRIEPVAFAGCSNLTTIDFPSTLQDIYVGSFSGCISLKAVTISSSVRYLGDNAFENCTSLTEVTILPGLESLGDHIFDGCKSLTSLSIPNTVESISTYAFAGLSGLMNITVDEGNNNFYTSGGVLYSKDEVLIRYPQGRSGAFEVPEGVVEISGDAFSGCHSLTGVTISSTVANVGGRSFDDLPSLESIDVVDGNNNFKSEGGVLFNKDGDVLVRYPGGKQGEYTIPESISEVAERAFYMCNGLTSVSVPGTIETISSYCFSGCSKLKSVTLLNGVKFIDPHAFEGCSELETVAIPNSLIYIADYAFYGCSSYSNIVLPENLVSIQAYAFAGCNPTTVTIPASVENIGENVFADCYSLERIDVTTGNPRYASPNGVLMDTLSGLLVQFPKAYQGDFEIPDNVISIDGKTFTGCSGLTSVTIPSSVMSIDIKPFAGCVNLASITVDGNNGKYGDIDGVLFDFETMTLIDFPEGRGGDYEVPEGVQIIEQRAFQGNTHLTSLVVPSTVATIGDHAFEGCVSLVSVKIGKGTSSIGDYAFAGCASLESIDYRGLRNPCDKVKNHTLEGCPNLKIICLDKQFDDYDAAFCGSLDICWGSSVDDINLQSNACIEEFCYNGFKILRERDNATQWRKKSNACVDFECDAVAGPVQWSMCNKTESANFMCMNDGCILRDQPIVVEIDMDNIQASEFDVDLLIIEIKACTGVEVTKVGYELGDQAFVVRVVVVIEDEDTGNTIANAVNKLDKGEDCQFPTLCRSKVARVIVKSLELSSAMTNGMNMVAAIFALIALVLALFN